jgi:replication factor A1
LLYRYKIPFVASDETYSLEFMFFEKRAAELIGKSAETLRKQHEPDDIPPEIKSWIGYKFVFVVTILSSKSINAIDPSFEVIRIKENLGKQPTVQTVAQFNNILVASASITAPQQEDLPQLIPITSKKGHTQVNLLVPTIFNLSLIKYKFNSKVSATEFIIRNRIYLQKSRLQQVLNTWNLIHQGM